MKAGDWVLLDELNLASQSVLEGLNALLDHRAQIYIPELGRSFDCAPSFRIFGAQNPLQQGGGRKGLPKSFLNRFTAVNVDELSKADMVFIAHRVHPKIPEQRIERMVEFNVRVQREAMQARTIGAAGRPWEFNLRDILRWCELIDSDPRDASQSFFVDMLYLQRLRSHEDRDALEVISLPLSPQSLIERRTGVWYALSRRVSLAANLFRSLWRVANRGQISCVLVVGHDVRCRPSESRSVDGAANRTCALHGGIVMLFAASSGSTAARSGRNEMHGDALALHPGLGAI